MIQSCSNLRLDYSFMCLPMLAYSYLSYQLLKPVLKLKRWLWKVVSKLELNVISLKTGLSSKTKVCSGTSLQGSFTTLF